MKRQKITTIFWDAGGVLFSDAEISQPNFKPVLDLLGITAADSDKIFARLWAEKLRLGKITEDQYWQEYIKDSRNKPNIQEVKKVYRSCIQPYEEALRIVEELSKIYDQFLLSNHAKEWMDYLIKHWQLGRWFKGFFCSAYLEIAKPDKRFYEIVLKTTGKTPVELLYIDDSERNIKAAAGLGIRVIIYAKNQDLRLSLERNGIVLKKNN